MKKILIIGENGQVGHELSLSAPEGFDIYTTSLEDKKNHPNQIQLDLCDTKRIKSIITDLRPDLVINAAAYTAVDKAESEQDLAMKVNADAPKAMAEVVKEISSWLIHYSTDYVYDGAGNHFRNENEPTNPINFYGQSKLAGEDAIRATKVNHIIFRTSWVFAAHGHNFVKTMLKLGSEREELSIVDDQIGSPTSARLIADVTWQMVEKINQGKLAGQQNLHHLCGKGCTSWHGFAKEVFDQARSLGFELKINQIQPVDSGSFKTAAKRPKNSRLDCTKLEKELSSELSSWKIELKNVLKGLSRK